MEEGIEDEEGRGVSCAFNHSSNYSPEAVLPNYLWGAHGPSPSFFLLRESPSLLFSLRFSLSLPSEAKRATIEELKLFELAHGCPECFQRKERKNELVARATSTDEKKKKTTSRDRRSLLRFVGGRRDKMYGVCGRNHDFCIENDPSSDLRRRGINRERGLCKIRPR